MSAEFDLNRLKAKYTRVSTSTPQRIEDQIVGKLPEDQSIELKHGHHNNKSEKARKDIYAFLRSTAFSSWVKGVEYNPQAVNGDITLYLSEETQTGDRLINLLGYSTMRVKAFSNTEKLDTYVEGRLLNNNGDFDDEQLDLWYAEKRVVLDNKSKFHMTTADLLFQMAVYSDNLCTEGWNRQFISQMDPTSIAIVGMSDVMQRIVRKRSILVDAFYPDFFTNDFDTDTQSLVKSFSLTQQS